MNSSHVATKENRHLHLGPNVASFLLPRMPTLPLVLLQGGSPLLQTAVKDKFINIWWWSYLSTKTHWDEAEG